MREILFKGKRIDNGKWVEGWFLGAEYTTSIINDNHDIFPVIPESVSEFSGLPDKNGKKIFEGDILKIARVYDSTGSYYFPPLAYPVNVVVKWDMCAWNWETLCEDKRYIHFPDAWCHYVCEVIGNIHDNPELLKGE